MNPDFQNGRSDKAGLCALLTGGLAGVLASACCLGPLVLITLGVSGAWIGNLTALEPYRLAFIVAAVIALFFAWRRIWRPAAACAPGQICAVPHINRSYKALFWVVVALVVVALGFPSIVPLFY